MGIYWGYPGYQSRDIVFTEYLMFFCFWTWVIFPLNKCYFMGKVKIHQWIWGLEASWLDTFTICCWGNFPSPWWTLHMLVKSWQIPQHSWWNHHFARLILGPWHALPESSADLAPFWRVPGAAQGCPGCMSGSRVWCIFNHILTLYIYIYVIHIII